MVQSRSKPRRRRLKLSEQGPHNAKAAPGTHEAWYYIGDGGVTVVAEIRGNAGYVGTTQAILTPAQIRKAAALLDRV